MISAPFIHRDGGWCVRIVNREIGAYFRVEGEPDRSEVNVAQEALKRFRLLLRVARYAEFASAEEARTAVVVRGAKASAWRNS